MGNALRRRRRSGERQEGCPEKSYEGPLEHESSFREGFGLKAGGQVF